MLNFLKSVCLKVRCFLASSEVLVANWFDLVSLFNGILTFVEGIGFMP